MMLRAAALCCALLLPCARAAAQGISRALVVACPKASEVTHHHLLGLWRAEFTGQSQGATLLLEQHPELAQSMRGAVNRNGERAEVSGDVDDGEFTLEESANGLNISATWLGDVVEGSCGHEIRGTWQLDGGGRVLDFVLRKMP